MSNEYYKIILKMLKFQVEKYFIAIGQTNLYLVKIYKLKIENLQVNI